MTAMMNGSSLLLKELIRRHRDWYDFAQTAFMTIDVNGVIRNINMAGARILGEKRKKLYGRPFWQYVQEENIRSFDDHLEKCRKLSSRIATELSLARSDGAPLPIVLLSEPERHFGAMSNFFRTAIFISTETEHRKRHSGMAEHKEPRLGTD